VLSSDVVGPKVDNDNPPSATVYSVIPPPSTAFSSTNRRFSTASKKAKKKRDARKKAKEAHDRAVMRRGRAREGRESDSTVQGKTSPLLHRGWSADFGCCLGTAMPTQSTVREKLSDSHRGLSEDIRCFLYQPTHPPTPLDKVIASGRLPTRFIAGCRLKCGKFLKESRGGRTRFYPKRYLRQQRKLARRRMRELNVAKTADSGEARTSEQFRFLPMFDDTTVDTNFCKDRDSCTGRVPFVFGNRRDEPRKSDSCTGRESVQNATEDLKVEDVALSEDEELAILLSPERNLRPSAGLVLEPVLSPERTALPSEARQSVISEITSAAGHPNDTSDPPPKRSVRLLGGAGREGAQLSNRPRGTSGSVGNGTGPITCPNVTGSSCFMSCGLLVLKRAVPLILQRHDKFDPRVIDDSYDADKVQAMHGPFMEFIAAMYLNLQDSSVVGAILHDLYEASGLKHVPKDVVEFFDFYILPILRAKGLSRFFDVALSTTEVWDGKVGEVQLHEVLSSGEKQDAFIKVEPTANMQSAVDKAVSSLDMEYTPREIYARAEETIHQLESSAGRELSHQEKSAIREPLVCNGKRHVYINKETQFIIFYIARLNDLDGSGLDVKMNLDKKIRMSVSLDEDGTSTERRDFHLDGVVLYRGRNDSHVDHYFALNAYEDGVYMQDDDDLSGPKSWEGWSDLTSDKVPNTCSYMAVYVPEPCCASSSPVAEENRAIAERLLRTRMSCNPLPVNKRPRISVARDGNLDRRIKSLLKKRRNAERQPSAIKEMNAGRKPEAREKENAKRKPVDRKKENAKRKPRKPEARKQENANRKPEARKKENELYYRKNRDALRLRAKKYYQLNRRVLTDKMKLYYQVNRDRIRAGRRESQQSGNDRNTVCADFKLPVDVLPLLDQPPGRPTGDVAHCVFDDSEQDPEVAATMMHFNSGRHIRRDALDLKELQRKTWNEMTVDERERFNKLVIKLEDQIMGECVTPACQKEALARFFRKQGQGVSWAKSESNDYPKGSRDMPYYCCAACGIQHAGDGSPYKRMNLDELECLKFDEEEKESIESKMQDPRYDSVVLPCDDKGTTRTVEVWKAYNFFPQVRKAENYFHLYPQFVEHPFRDRQDSEELEELDDRLDEILPDTKVDGPELDTFQRLQEKYICMNDQGNDIALFSQTRGRLELDFPGSPGAGVLYRIGDDDVVDLNRRLFGAEVKTWQFAAQLRTRRGREPARRVFRRRRRGGQIRSRPLRQRQGRRRGRQGREQRRGRPV